MTRMVNVWKEHTKLRQGAHHVRLTGVVGVRVVRRARPHSCLTARRRGP